MDLNMSKYKIDFTSSALKFAYLSKDKGLPCTVAAKKNVQACSKALDVRVIKNNGELIAVSEEEFQAIGYPEITIDHNHEEVKAYEFQMSKTLYGIGIIKADSEEEAREILQSIDFEDCFVEESCSQEQFLEELTDEQYLKWDLPVFTKENT